jgi:NAD(P)-dependent dehydrogenase (short-subunit alcohol dehydrogenase family)
MNLIRFASGMNGAMKGKTCLITGATSGIGKETALALARMGAKVVFTARTSSIGVATRDDIIRASGNPSTDFIECDLSDLTAVRACCCEFRETNDRLHVLINNAGTWRPHREVSKDGFEMTFAVNHLAHFLMTNLLKDVMRRSAPARIISVSSGLHGGTIKFDDIMFERRYWGMAAYRQSKLANILFVKELSRRLSGTGVTANCLMPGFVHTGLFRDSSVISKTFARVFGMSPQKGAETTIYLASSPEVEGVTGECFKKKRIARTSKESGDPELASRLWAFSEKCTQRWLTAGPVS